MTNCREKSQFIGQEAACGGWRREESGSRTIGYRTGSEFHSELLFGEICPLVLYLALDSESVLDIFTTFS